MSHMEKVQMMKPGENKVSFMSDGQKLAGLNCLDSAQNKVAVDQLVERGFLARVLATRAAHPGHLWVAMGLFERPELSAAIRRHLPALADANHRNMRWKRFLYKQLCDAEGIYTCRSPSCEVCVDYDNCFGNEE